MIVIQRKTKKNSVHINALSLPVTHNALCLLLYVRLERAWVAACLSAKLSLLSPCTTAGIPPETRINSTHSQVVSMLMLCCLCACLFTQVSEAIFAG